MKMIGILSVTSRRSWIVSPFFFFVLTAVASAPAAKAEKAPTPAPVAKSAAPATQFASEAVERGKKVYRINCLQCHNADPRKPGTQGPALYGSSLELLEMRVLTRKYPAGYKPQRKTAIMPALPFLKKDIPNLRAFLNSPLQ